MTTSSKRMKPYSAAKTLTFLMQEVPDVHTDDGRLVPTEAAITYTRYEDGHRVTSARVTGVMRNGELDLTDTIADLNYSDGPNDDWPEWLETLAMDDQPSDFTPDAGTSPTADSAPGSFTDVLSKWTVARRERYAAAVRAAGGQSTDAILAAVMTVADVEMNPAYRDGYGTGRAHAGAEGWILNSFEAVISTSNGSYGVSEEIRCRDCAEIIALADDSPSLLELIVLAARHQCPTQGG